MSSLPNEMPHKKASELADRGISHGRVSRLSAVKDHSRNVRVLRLFLPIAALGVIFAYVVMAQPTEINPHFERQFAQLEDSENMRMASPSFSGEDARGNQFEVSADTAQHIPGNPESIMLQNPRAIRAEGLENELSASAEIGVLRPDDGEVDLTKDVEFTRGFGGDLYYLQTEKAVVGLENRTIQSDSGVFAQGQRGTLDAETMLIDDATGRVSFGNARMVIKPRQSRESVQPAEGNVKNDVASQQSEE